MADHISPVPQEAKKVQKLETSLQNAEAEHPGSKAAADARHALQTELDAINGSAAVKKDPDYVNRLQRRIAQDDAQGKGTGDGKAHRSALTIDNSKLGIAPDQIIRFDESESASRRRDHLPVTMSDEQAEFARRKPLTAAQILENERQEYKLPKGTPAHVIKGYESDKLGVMENLYELACAKGGIILPGVRDANSAAQTLNKHLEEVNKQGPAFVKRIYDALPPQYQAAIKIDSQGHLSTDTSDMDKKLAEIRPH